jgi:hypothetical protein
MDKRLLFFAAISIALLCNFAGAAYSEKVLVQVFDQNLRPIEGAQIYAEHQLNDAQGAVKTKPVLTNQSGLGEIVFTNYEQIESDVDYSYTLYVKYGGQLSTRSLIASGDIKNVKVVSETSLKSYLLSVKVIDQRGSPLRARISVGGQNKTADYSGSAFFQLPPGNFTVKAEIGDVVSTQGLVLSQDAAADFNIGLYGMEVEVTDDKGYPLVATVEAGGKKMKTGQDGRAVFYNLSDQYPAVNVKYNETIKKFNMDLERQPKLEVTFDMTSPVVKEMHASIAKNGAGTLSVFVEDPGASSAGIDSVSISYEIDGVENRVPAYAIGYNTFEAKFPPQAPRTLVKYVVKVTDKEGNTAFGSGTYLVPSDDTPKPNATTTKPVAPQPKPQQVGMETLVVGLVIFFAVAFAIFYYLRNRKGQGGIAPPPAGVKPPSIPPA